MQLQEFIDKTYRKGKKLRIEELDFFSKGNYDSWTIKIQNDIANIQSTRSGTVSLNKPLDEFFKDILPKHAAQFNTSLIEFFTRQNHFIDGLPLFIIRRHGSYSGESGSKMRRRGWLVRFNNGWIIYADNFLTRHFFEASYLVENFKCEDLATLVNSFLLPFSSGGGFLEKKHRAFPSLTHLTARSGLYLSHVYDLNKKNYLLGCQMIKASDVLGWGIDGRFGCGKIEDWDVGGSMKGQNFKYRIMNSELSEQELRFLTAYNIRMLSPFNYFPFPKTKLLVNSSVTGESEQVRARCGHFYSTIYQDNFRDFLDAAGAESKSLNVL